MVESLPAKFGKVKELSDKTKISKEKKVSITIFIKIWLISLQQKDEKAKIDKC